MPALRDMLERGGRDALAAFGVSSGQPSLGSIGIKSPVKSPGLPGAAKPPAPPTIPTPGSAPGGGLGVAAAKIAHNVGMGASTSSDGAGAQAGEPADEGRRQRSLIDRTFQQNDDFYATSSMPLPGAVVSP